MKAPVWSLLLLALSAAPVAQGKACSQLQPEGDPLVWLKAQDQHDLEQIFKCAQPSATAGIPLGFGRGTGSIVAGAPAWNDLQAAIGGALWGGKVFTADASGVTLINKLLDGGNERYHAQVYVDRSVLDNQPVILLDYRIDASPATYGEPLTPAQALVDKIAHGIRDEIREITVNGQPTHVFIGRASLYKQMFVPGQGLLSHPDFTIDDVAFADPDSWLMLANFYLDFRG